jgi:hypothetical protein
VGSLDDRFYAFTSAGLLLWSYATGGDIWSSAAMSSDGTLYFGSYDHNLYALTSGGVLAWSFTTGGEVVSSPAVRDDGRIFVASHSNVVFALNGGGAVLWTYRTARLVDSSPAIDSAGRVYVGSSDNTLYVFEGPPMPTPTALPNYLNLAAEPASIHPGGTVTLEYSCYFGNYPFWGMPVDVYVAAVRAPRVIDAPSSVDDVLQGGGAVYLFENGMKSYYRYRGTVRKPTYAGVAFPPLLPFGSLHVIAPPTPGAVGDYVFAAAFYYSKKSGRSGPVRTDGLPVENSNLFTIE